MYRDLVIRHISVDITRHMQT